MSKQILVDYIPFEVSKEQINELQSVMKSYENQDYNDGCNPDLGVETSIDASDSTEETCCCQI